MFAHLGGQVAICCPILVSAQVPRLYVNTEIKASVCNYQAGRSESENLTRGLWFTYVNDFLDSDSIHWTQD